MGSARSAADLDEADLLALGYRVARFRDGRACVIWDASEQWVGEGVDEKSAFASALTRMLPAGGARAVVLRALRARLDASRAAAPESTTTTPCSSVGLRSRRRSGVVV